MNPRIKRMLVTGAIVCGVVFYLFSLFGRTRDMIESTNIGPDTTGPGIEAALPGPDRTTPSAMGTPPASTSADQGIDGSSPTRYLATRRIYAVGLHELSGLSQESAPGTRLELWVTWSPPITRTPRVQRLLRDVILEEIVPPVVPEGPVTAVLSLPHKDVADLIFGDRYGELSAIAAR